MEQLTNGGKFGSVDANHAQTPNLASPSEVKHGETDNTNLLVRRRGGAINEASGVLAGTYLRTCKFWELIGTTLSCCFTIRILGGDILEGD